MYNDPSGEFFVAGFFLTWIAPIIWGAIVGAAVGAGIYLVTAAITGNWSWSGFGKAILLGAVTGGITGGLGQVFSTTSIWGGIGNGALTGSIGGGVDAIFSGKNFFDGVLKGAAFGGAIGGITWGINYLVNTKRVRFYMEDSDANTLKPGTPVGKRDYARSLYEKEFGIQDGLNKNDIYNDASRLGGKMNSNGAIEYSKNGTTTTALGVTDVRIDKTTGLRVGKIRMYLSNKAFVSREQLAFVMQHELNHVRIANAGLFNASEIAVNMGNLIDNVGHYHIQESGTNFLINNGWYEKIKIGSYVTYDTFNSSTFQKFNDTIHKLLIGTDRKININFK